MPKISKSSGGYQCKPDTQYTCDDCAMVKEIGKAGKDAGCAWFGPSVPISRESGSCNYFGHCDACGDMPWLGVYTKLELGYVENRQGFSCKRCEHVNLRERNCSVVDRNSPGDDPGAISPNGCCNFWEPDKQRAAMSTEKLNEYIALLGSDLKTMSADDYRRMRNMD